MNLIQLTDNKKPYIETSYVILRDRKEVDMPHLARIKPRNKYDDVSRAYLSYSKKRRRNVSHEERKMQDIGEE